MIRIILLLFSGSATAFAGIDAAIYQDGSHVVMDYSGSLDLTDLTGPDSAFSNGGVHGTPSAFYIASPALVEVDTYTGINGPASFMATGDFVDVNLGSGAFFGVVAGGAVTQPGIYVENGYTGSNISGSAQFNNTTIAALGLIEGEYQWTWGAGPTADFVDLTIGNVPEPGTWAIITGLVALGMAYLRRSRIRA